MSETTPASGGRGARTRQRILDAARLRFASDGYDRATIRAIAADAEVDPALVMRYFGNKDELFAAAADFDLRLPTLAGLSQDKVARTLAMHFLQRWEEDDTLMALLRSAGANDSAAERLRAIFAQQVIPAIAPLSAGTAAQTARRASLLASQMLGMALCRYVLKLPPLVAMSREDLADHLAPTLKRYLFA
jgi:AcrR family transcriptional regulator